MRALYRVLKEQQENIRFVFITGISKFSQVGVFSALNNLNDISLDEDYAALVGYTRKEIETNFTDHIIKVREKLSISEKEFWEKLKHYYNGYSWDGETAIYNPFSVLNFLQKKK